MTDSNFRSRNHYVAEFLLRNFTGTDGKLSEYRLLVDDSRVREWRPSAPSRAARFEDLYTVAVGKNELDSVKRWLDKEFESPARSAVIAAANGIRLDRHQWRLLQRLYAAQYVRTPAYYIRHKDIWAVEMERILSEAKERLLKVLPTAIDPEREEYVLDGPDRFPLKYTIRRHEGLRRSLQLQHVTGRKHWMWHIKQSLRAGGPLDLLANHQWSIITAPKGLSWFLSDNPATCLNIRRDGTQTLDGGWGTYHSVMMLPLSPKRMLYCKVGETFEDRYPVVHPFVANQLRAGLADSALRSVFCCAPDVPIARYRPRRVDKARFTDELLQWRQFGEEQSAAERFIPFEASDPSL